MLCGQQVEPMLVVCMMRQGPGGWSCLARNLSSQQQKHTPDKNWPNPSGCQSLTGQLGFLLVMRLRWLEPRIRGTMINILELPVLAWQLWKLQLWLTRWLVCPLDWSPLDKFPCSLSWKTTKGWEMWAGIQIINQIITDPPQQYSPDSYSHTPSL